jgi:hypothetical protein
VARYNDSNHNSGTNAIDVDASGNIYVALITVYDFSAGSSAIDGVVMKYDSNGNVVWKNLMNIGNYGDDWTSKIMVKNGFVYAGGTFNGGDHGYGDNSRNSVVWKYSSDGQLVWTATHDGGGADYFADFAVDGQGNLYITSLSDRLLTGYYNTDSYLYDFATAKFDANGQLIWNSRYNNTDAGDHRPGSIALDANGNVYVTGTSDGDGTGKDIATIKYSGNNGDQLWVKRHNGSANGDDSAGTVRINREGDVYVTGTSLNIRTGLDFTAIKYSSNGTQKDVTNYGRSTGVNETLTSAVLNHRGELVLTGTSTDASGIPKFLTVNTETD